MIYEQIVDRLEAMGLTKQMSTEKGKYCWPIPVTKQEIMIVKLKVGALHPGYCIDIRTTGSGLMSQIRGIPYPAEDGFKEIQKIIMDKVDPWHKLGRSFTTADWKDPRKISKFVIYDDI